MGYARVDDRWSFCDLETLILESDTLRVIVTPGQGGRIHQLMDKATGRELFWTHPRRDPHAPRFGERHSGRLGGVDEFFPTGWPCTYQGEELIAHGDFLTLPWRCDVLEWGDREATVRLWCSGVTVPVRLERYMTLRAGRRALCMRHRLINQTAEPYPFLWTVHTSFDGSGDYRIDLPAGRVYEDNYQAQFDPEELPRYEWPLKPWKGSAVDMRRPPPPGWPPLAMHYAMVQEGWLAYTYLEDDVGLGVAFDHHVFPVVTLWIVRGSSGRYLTAVHPWSGWPLRLTDAVERGIAGWLPASGVLETETCWVVYSGVHEVSGVSLNGDVSGRRRG